MKKRLLACALAAVFTLALLAGCSRKSESPGPEDAGQKEETGLTEVTLCPDVCCSGGRVFCRGGN